MENIGPCHYYKSIDDTAQQQQSEVHPVCIGQGATASHHLHTVLHSCMPLSIHIIITGTKITMSLLQVGISSE